MDISLNNLGKRYRFEWIFRNLDYSIQNGTQLAISGPNGSGKSTLLKILSGHLTPSKGAIKFNLKNQLIEPDNVFRYISIATPYMDLIEELTLEEMIDFHTKFKKFFTGISTSATIDILRLEKSKRKEIKFFSSGMKQRLKLALAFLSDTPLLLLDEPTTNLDQEGVKWYRELVDKYTNNRTLIIASNIEHDFDFCKSRIDIMDYKKKKNPSAI